MEKYIQYSMNEQIIRIASLHYGVPFESIKRLGGFENFIYQYSLNGKEFVLRFVHSRHRSYEHVYAELEFIDYLAKSGANVSTVVPTINDLIVFKIESSDKDYFSVSVFTKAPGGPVKKEELREEFIYDFGKVVGKLHALTKDYKANHLRYHWYEEDYVEIAKRSLPKDKEFIIQKTTDHYDRIKQYDMNKDSYGLIHTDLHFGNMFYDGQTLTIFDWDDSSYKHFISDIAIIIFYSFGLSDMSDIEIEDKTIWFLKSFIKGYETENYLDRMWYEQLNDFFKLRELILVIVIYAAGDDKVESAFGRYFLKKYVDRIKNDTPFFNIQRVVDEIWNS